MKFQKNDGNYVVRLEKGEQILKTLLEFCKNENIHSAYFNGIGAFESSELGFYHLDRKEYEWRKFENPMEVVSLTGNVSLVDNEPFLHIHTVLSDDNFQTVGGHLKEATVGATLELFIKILNAQLTRATNDEVGLKLLELKS